MGIELGIKLGLMLGLGLGHDPELPICGKLVNENSTLRTPISSCCTTGKMSVGWSDNADGNATANIINRIAGETFILD